MSKLQEKQSQLNELYKKKFLGENTYIELEKYSPPLLLNLDVENLDTRIMFVGQETNGWWDVENSNWRNENVINKLLDTYKNFMNNYYLGMSNQFFMAIKDILGDANIKPVWNNVFKFDSGVGDRKISTLIKKEQDLICEFHKGILAKELEIINPQLVIFFTGHDYDRCFFDKVVLNNGDDYRDLYKKTEHENLQDEWQIGRLDLKNFNGFENFKGKAYRTYHPRYFMQFKPELKEQILPFLKSEVEKVFS